MKQNISLPTHKSGSTLDLIITRADENIASKFIVFDPFLPDHYMVGCTLSLTKVPFEKKKMGYRRLKSINFDGFRHDVSASLKHLLDENTNLNDNIDHYSKSLLDALSKHAPLKNRVITLRPCAPWYTPENDEAKKKRRKLERRWRSSHLTIDHELYVMQCNAMQCCKRAYFLFKEDVLLYFD